jgi:hypothetical protein
MAGAILELHTLDWRLNLTPSITSPPSKGSLPPRYHDSRLVRATSLTKLQAMAKPREACLHATQRSREANKRRSKEAKKQRSNVSGKPYWLERSDQDMLGPRYSHKTW